MSAPASLFERRLELLGAETDPPGSLLIEGEPAVAGAAWSLVRRRSPWNPYRDVDRVIVGSDRNRADLRLEGDGIPGELLRLYLPKQEPGPNDLKAVVDGLVTKDGREVPHSEWCPLVDGDEIVCLGWRFRFCQSPVESSASEQQGS